ncbi:hypothetical protein [Mesobacillus jeotgali]|uniref:hypothetical protein n=1 Tax=Mesobacillus jeotgali TaxID=129985 RepID=UPI001785212C|nr:hypothetical protein [Mesobacillus jeotgali]UYZ21746.1 hypothetical protein FOF60_22570 [Mesobacillus jeotgali]
MNVWLMKTFKDWAARFMKGDPEPFVAIDEPGVDVGYGDLSDAKQSKLFRDLEKSSDSKRRWGLIKTFFDRFYIDVKKGDVLVLGTGQTTKFFVYAIVKIKSDAYYVNAPDSTHSRHRRDVEILWMDEPFQVDEWGWARRLEILDTKDRLKEFIKVYTELKNSN